MADPLPIEINDLEMVYKPGLLQKHRVGLRNLTMSVQPGELYGYVGGNGAGKTTTIKILVGLLFPTNGRALIYGKEVLDESCRHQIGFLPENPYFYEYLTAEEALVFYGRLSGLDRDAARKRAGELLERVGLGGVDARVKGFSKGMRQRLGLAQALLHDPPLVILDEPMSGLDPRGRRDVRDLMVELRERGKTVFFSTHILSDVESICDRVGMLRRGELVKAGALHEIVRDQVQGVEVAFDGAPESVAQDARRRRPRPEGGVLAEVATQPDADRLVDAVREAGGSVLAVTPLRESLEDVFLQLEPKDDGEVKEEASQEAAS